MDGRKCETASHDQQLLDTTSGSSFAKWKSGNTNYPIVDACMRQLNATGYMSNRGRQLVASCLIHELGIDWRHGAAYFESQLIDYDVASNWGNWALSSVDTLLFRHYVRAFFYCRNSVGHTCKYWIRYF